MRNRRSSQWCLVAAWAVVVLASPASARTIEITEGFLDVTGLSGIFSLVGEGFRFAGSVDAVGGILGPFGSCVPCPPPGTEVSIASRWSGSDIRGLPGTSCGPVAVLDGVVFENVGGLQSDSGADIRWGGSITIPPLDSEIFLTAPFEFSGEFFHFGDGRQNIDLVGSGLVTVRLLGFEPDPGVAHWEYGGRARWEIPVPEPGTLLLLASGAAAVGTVRRRRRGDHPARGRIRLRSRARATSMHAIAQTSPAAQPPRTSVG